MLQQHAGKGLQGCTPLEFDAAAQAFEDLPLWFLTFYGRFVVCIFLLSVIIMAIMSDSPCKRMFSMELEEYYSNRKQTTSLG
jgi:hypothetical protein